MKEHILKYYFKRPWYGLNQVLYVRYRYYDVGVGDCNAGEGWRYGDRPATAEEAQTFLTRYRQRGGKPRKKGQA